MKKMLKFPPLLSIRFLALQLLFIFSFTIFIPQALAFQDVTSSDPYFQAVQYFQQKGILEDKKFFSGQNLIKRAEFDKIAWNTAGFRAKKGTKGVTKFKDVPADSWFAPYVKKSLAAGVLHLNEGDPFYRPENAVTRLEALDFIFQVKGIGVAKVIEQKEIRFKDIKAGSAYAPIAKKAQDLGLFSNEKKFQPLKKMTRAEAVQILYDIEQTIGTGKDGSEVQFQIIQIESSTTPGGKEAESFTKNEKFPLLIDVWTKLRKRSVNKNKISENDLMYGAINGMVEKLGDPYSAFQEPKMAVAFNESLNGEFEGIGISIDMIEEKITVITPIRNTPAEKAGLKPNDIITKVDDKSVAGLKLEQVANMIKGQKNTSVKLTIQRGAKELNFTIVREKIKLVAVDAYMKGDVGVVEIHSFNQDTDLEFKSVMANFLTKNKPKTLVIDLRNNPGGFLDTALHIVDLFLEKGKKIATLSFASPESAKETFNDANKEAGRVTMPKDTEIEYVSLGEGNLGIFPIVILQNRGSASASEIMAAALKENGEATIVGDNSFGKGSVQELTNYADGSLFKLSIAKWLTPNGVNLTENPIKPDVLVKDDPEKEGDEMLEKALELAK